MRPLSPAGLRWAEAPANRADGALNYVPFESLVIAVSADYSSLPYLISLTKLSMRLRVSSRVIKQQIKPRRPGNLDMADRFQLA